VRSWKDVKESLSEGRERPLNVKQRRKKRAESREQRAERREKREEK
jgi:hypothetical protein